MPLWLRIDWKLMHFFNQDLAHPILDPIMHFLSNWQLWWVVAGAFFFVALIRRSRRGLRLAIVLGVAVGLTDLLCYRELKPYFQRLRPCHQTSELRLPEGCGSRFGLPSNHAANGMAVTTVLAVSGTGIWAISSFVLALLVGISRVYLGVHFPTDVLVGFAVGSLVGLAVSRILEKSSWRSAKSLYLRATSFVKSLAKENQMSPAFEISVEELKERLNRREEIHVLDVRDPSEFELANLGGQLIPLSELPHRYQELSKDREMVVLCHHGIRSAKAVEFLKRQGFSKIKNLRGGIDRWSEIADPRLPRY